MTERDFIMSKFQVIEHPLIQHKLTIMRKKETTTREFKQLLDEISMLMGYELTRNLPTEDVEIETPICKTVQKKISGKKLAIVPILRAGLGMVNGVHVLFPSAKVGHSGLYRNEETLEPCEYYCKLPVGIEDKLVLLVDPMLATGGSAVAAIDFLKARGCKNIIMMNIIGCPEGIKRVQEAHPDVELYLAACDERLNDHAYIIPGLGDAGDRIFGTK